MRRIKSKYIGKSFHANLLNQNNIGIRKDAWKQQIGSSDCTGPVVLMVSLQQAVHASNSVNQKFVRANLASWYKDFATDFPTIYCWRLYLTAQTGRYIGTSLRPEVREKENVVINTLSLWKHFGSSPQAFCCFFLVLSLFRCRAGNQKFFSRRWIIVNLYPKSELLARNVCYYTASTALFLSG